MSLEKIPSSMESPTETQDSLNMCSIYFRTCENKCFKALNPLQDLPNVL